ncbi:MAG TPA: ABC transporter ATP-binding protein [Armatimonadota bacterium]|jgi:subfamily B ATP-binding cassette protein MsbA
METNAVRKSPPHLIRLLRYVRPYWPSFAGATLFGLVKFLTPVAAAWVTGEAVGVLQRAGQGVLPPEMAWTKLCHLLFIGIVVTLASSVPTYLRSSIGARAVQSVVRDLRCDLYAHIQKLDHAFFNAHRSGSLTSRIISDSEALQPFLGQALVQGWMNAGVIIVVLAFFFSRNVYLALLSLVLLPCHIFIQRVINWRVKDNARTIRDRLAALAGSTQEKLAASTVVKAFTREDDETQRFSEDSAELIELGIRNSLLGGVSQAVVSTLNSLAPLLVMLVGGYIGIFHSETLSLGLLVQFVLMQGQLYGPFERLNELQLVTANALGATERIFTIFDTEPEVADRPRAIQAPSFRGEIIFRNVTFAYPDNNTPTLIDLTLEIPARTTLALVGPSGGGKSTITYLMTRFYEWQAGSIAIDGRDIRDYKIFSLRNQIGLVPQEPTLFSGTIEENIAYGRPGASPEAVREAAQRAYAAEFIESMDDGYETMLGERGVKLSGGQKQRIAIARAFLKDPAILILDEATSALDSESERYVQQALEDLMQERTTVVIAHRLSTIRHADRIAAIAAGRLVEIGSHDELLQIDGLYANLCRQQYSLGAVEIPETWVEGTA